MPPLVENPRMTTSRLHLADALGQQSTDRRIDILRRIGQVGSISKAARGAGVSYKAAWQAIDTLSNLAGLALVERLVGGAGGGGARLTPAGLSLLDAARKMNQARVDVLDEIASTAGAGKLPHLAALALRTSMRNQLPCVVHKVKPDAGAVRVEMALADGTRICSRITKESAQLLGLKPGLAVLALCKATAVVMATSLKSALGRNLLAGQVSRASRSTRGAELALTLPSGLQLVGFTPPGVILKVGSSAMATLDEAAVVVALAG
jgi:molybdate transport system regulatory protein